MGDFLAITRRYLATAGPRSHVPAAVRYGATPMAGYLIMAGIGAASVLGAASRFGRPRSGFGGRALGHLGTMVTVIAMSVTAALMAVAFLGEHLVGAPDLARFFALGNLGSALYWMLVSLFAAMTGLIMGCAATLSPEGCRRLHWHWRRLPLR